MGTGTVARRFLPLFFLLGSSSAAYAAEFSDPRPHYVPAGGGFACTMSKEEFEQGQAQKRDVCLRIGPLYVGMTRADAETILGKPVTNMPANGREAFAYHLQSDAAGNMITYAFAVYDDNARALSVQLTGAPWSGNWPFAGLTLGSAEEAVAARLGTPKQTRKSEDEGAVHWSYLPWTFSFEIKAGVVSSIRIAVD